MSRRSDAEKMSAYLFGRPNPSKHKLAKKLRAKAKKAKRR